MIDPKDLVLVARLLGGHGLQGHVKLKAFLESPQDLLGLNPLVTQDQRNHFELLSLLERPKLLLGRFKGITSRTQADDLKGLALYGNSKLFKDLDEDTFYTKDLIGLPIVDSEEKKTLGTVKDVLRQKSGDILSITALKSGKEILLPFRKEFFPKVVLTSPQGVGWLLLDTSYLHEFDNDQD